AVPEPPRGRLHPLEANVTRGGGAWSTPAVCESRAARPRTMRGAAGRPRTALARDPLAHRCAADLLQPRLVRAPPRAEGPQRLDEVLAGGRERVLDLGRHDVVHLPVHHLVALELAQVLGKHLLADARDGAAQLAEPLRAAPERPEDEHLPLAADHVDARVEAGHEHLAPLRHVRTFR